MNAVKAIRPYTHIYKIIYVIFLMIVCSVSKAQSISPVTQNIGGTLGLQSNYTLTFSIGEMVSTTHFVGADKTSISSGFLQSFTPLVTGIENIALIAPGVISIMPNPVISKMNLRARFSKPGDMEFNIVDMTSSVKYQSQKMRVYDVFTKEVDLSNLVAGVYYVRVLYQPYNGNPEMGIYKFVKL